MLQQLADDYFASPGCSDKKDSLGVLATAALQNLGPLVMI